MAESFYEPGEQRAAKVKELFTLIAPRYDLINDLQSAGWHRYWKAKAVALARPEPGHRALDVCCGTGDLARALARRGARVVGLDFSVAMLRAARAKADQAGMTLPWVCGDAQQLPFPDNSFEIVTVGYGLRNLAVWETGLREMARVAKPGGRVVVLDFGKPQSALWRGLYFAYLKLLVPVLGRIFCGNARAYAYILESLKHYPAQRGVAEQMRGLGLAQIQSVEFMGGAMSIHCGVKGAVPRLANQEVDGVLS
jgi:demethylmenaquinone methyltransferase/2-methoxy-6-polyprenyl-1,4-benzoquinol methylase